MAKTAKLSDTMEEALVYLSRGAYRAHLEPAKKTLEALERRGMIVWTGLDTFGDVIPVHDSTRLWTVTVAGWNFLAEKYGRKRPADEGRMTVEEALEEVVVIDGRMYSTEEISMRVHSAHRFGEGLVANPESDPSGITNLLVKLGLVQHTMESNGTKFGYCLTVAGEAAARENAKFMADEGELVMDADALAAANFAANRPAADEKPVSEPGDALLTAGNHVEVRRSRYDSFNRSWTPQPAFSAVYVGYHRNGLHIVREEARGTLVFTPRETIHRDDRLSVETARDLADLMRRTGLDLADCTCPENWPTA